MLDLTFPLYCFVDWPKSPLLAASLPGIPVDEPKALPPLEPEDEDVFLAVAELFAELFADDDDDDELDEPANEVGA